MQRLVQPKVCDVEVQLVQEHGRPAIVRIGMEWGAPVRIEGEGY